MDVEELGRAKSLGVPSLGGGPTDPASVGTHLPLRAANGAKSAASPIPARTMPLVTMTSTLA